MFKINKMEPSFFIKSKNKIKLPNVKSAWIDKKIVSINLELREYILSKEQSHLCAYCEKRIDSNSRKSNIDHFKKRDLFPEKTLNYENLLVSCNKENRCSSFKDSKKRKLIKINYKYIINPVLDDPNNYFDYLATGEILPKETLTEEDKKKAEFTINIFQLNNLELRYERKTIMKSLYSLKYQFSGSEILNILNSYRSFITVMYNRLLTF